MAKPQEEIKLVQIPLVGDLNNRSFRIFSSANTGMDQFYQNCMFDVLSAQDGTKTYYVKKRPGFQPIGALPTFPTYGPESLDHWKGSFYVSTYNKIFKDSTDLGLTLTNNSFPGVEVTHPLAPTQYIGFNVGTALYLVSAAGTVVVMNNVVITTSSVANPSVITTATPHGLVTGMQIIIRNHTGSTPTINDTLYTVTVTGANTFTIPVNVTVGGTAGTIGYFPANVGDLVFMDGYWFVLDASGRIYQSNYNDPTTWDSTKYIIAQLGVSPGESTETQGIGLTRNSNSLIAFSNTNIQVFVDAANTSGSVLQNVDSITQQIGCAWRTSIASQERDVLWVSSSSVGSRTVCQLDGLSAVKVVSNPFVSALLAVSDPIKCSLVRIGGKRLYLIPMVRSGELFATAMGTLVYDLDAEIWSVWTSAAGGNYSLYTFCIAPGIQTGLPAGFDYGDNALFAGGYVTGGTYYISLVSPMPTSDSETYTDGGSNYSVVGQVRPLDFDTDTFKFCKSVALVGDKQTSTTNVSLQYSDDDFITLSTARTLDMSDPHPIATRLGKFRRRGWKWTYSGTGALRLQSLQLKLRMGVD